MSKLIFIISLVLLASFALACNASSDNATTGKTIKSASAGNNLTVTLSNANGVLKHGQQDVMVAFTDASGKPVDVGAASLNFYMPAMGSMAAMNNAAKLTTTNTPGVYRGMVDIEMAGEWQAQITYEGPAGKGKATLPVTAQ